MSNNGISVKITIKDNLHVSEELLPIGRLRLSPFSMEVTDTELYYGLNVSLAVFCTQNNSILRSRMTKSFTRAAALSTNHEKLYRDISESNIAQQSISRDVITTHSDGHYYANYTTDTEHHRQVCSFVYVSFAERRHKIVLFAAFLVAHLSVFFYVFQVFNDRGVIMQVCCYSQLGLLLISFAFYAFTYIFDALILWKASKIVRRIFDPQDNVIIHLCSTDRCARTAQITSKENVLANETDYLPAIYSSVIDALFAIAITAIEALTIAYVYTNVSKNPFVSDK